MGEEVGIQMACNALHLNYKFHASSAQWKYVLTRVCLDEMVLGSPQGIPWGQGGLHCRIPDATETMLCLPEPYDVCMSQPEKLNCENTLGWSHFPRNDNVFC